jgi:hypothetical protein
VSCDVTRSRRVCGHRARWTEMHPPDLIEVRPFKEPRITTRAVALAAHGAVCTDILHIPAVLAQRLGTVSASPSTWVPPRPDGRLATPSAPHRTCRGRR